MDAVKRWLVLGAVVAVAVATCLVAFQVDAESTVPAGAVVTETAQPVEVPAVAAVPAVAPTDVIGDESTAGDVAIGLDQVVGGVRSGEWSAIAGGLIFLLVALFKLPLLGGLVKKIPSRWRIVIVLVLGAASGLIASVAGGVSWYQACYVWLFSSSSGVFAHELFVESLFGKKLSET